MEFQSAILGPKKVHQDIESPCWGDHRLHRSANDIKITHTGLKLVQDGPFLGSNKIILQNGGSGI